MVFDTIDCSLECHTHRYDERRLKSRLRVVRTEIERISELHAKLAEVHPRAYFYFFRCVFLVVNVTWKRIDKANVKAAAEQCEKIDPMVEKVEPMFMDQITLVKDNFAIKWIKDRNSEEDEKELTDYIKQLSRLVLVLNQFFPIVYTQ